MWWCHDDVICNRDLSWGIHRFPQEKLIFQISTKTKLLKKQRVVINILRLKMIKQTKPNNLTLPDLQNMCFWWRYKVLKKSKKIERAIFAGLSHSRGTEPNFAGSKWRRSIAAGLTFDSLACGNLACGALAQALGPLACFSLT